MTGESNKGRFKCADEAQAAWKLFERRVANIVRRAFKGELGVESQNAANGFFEFFANDLHEARLIHGSIYDEDRRIENKDLAHELWLSYQESGWWFNNLDGHILDSVRHKKFRGTIFYE